MIFSKWFLAIAVDRTDEDRRGLPPVAVSNGRNFFW